MSIIPCFFTYVTLNIAGQQWRLSGLTKRQHLTSHFLYSLSFSHSKYKFTASVPGKTGAFLYLQA